MKTKPKTRSKPETRHEAEPEPDGPGVVRRHTARTYPSGFVKIRQLFARSGEPYCVVSIPAATRRYLGWKPGEYVRVYPTTDGALKLCKDSLPDDADMRAIPPGEDMKQPAAYRYTPGQAKIAKLEQLIADNEARRSKAGPGGDPMHKLWRKELQLKDQLAAVREGREPDTDSSYDLVMDPLTEKVGPRRQGRPKRDRSSED